MQLPGETLLSRMWDTVAEKGIGALLRPWQIRREGRALAEVRRDELLLIAQAEHDAQEIRAGRVRLLGSGSDSLSAASASIATAAVDAGSSGGSDRESAADVANNAATANRLREEINVAKALLHAESTLESDSSTPPSSKVDDDWLFRWRDAASGVSAEYLQHLWGRVLAGEITSPGSISLRTLDFLRNISQDEARAIERLAPLVLGGFVYRDKAVLAAGGVNFAFLLDMQDLGLLTGVDATGLEVTLPSSEPNRFVRLLTSSGFAIIVTHDDAARSLRLPIYKVTPIGTQVLNLGAAQPSSDYLRAVGERICALGFVVHLGRFFHISDSEIRYFADEPLCPAAVKAEPSTVPPDA